MLVINVLHIVLECHYYREHPKSIYYNRKGAKMVHPLLDMHRDGHTHQKKNLPLMVSIESETSTR